MRARQRTERWEYIRCGWSVSTATVHCTMSTAYLSHSNLQSLPYSLLRSRGPGLASLFPTRTPSRGHRRLHDVMPLPLLLDRVPDVAVVLVLARLYRVPLNAFAEMQVNAIFQERYSWRGVPKSKHIFRCCNQLRTLWTRQTNGLTNETVTQTEPRIRGSSQSASISRRARISCLVGTLDTVLESRWELGECEHHAVEED